MANKNKQANQRSASRPTANRKAEKGRKSNRVPLGQHRKKMTVDPALKERLENEGYVLRWINDDLRGRIDGAQQAGYQFVTSNGVEQIGDDGEQNTDPGSRVSMRVGTCEDGSPMRAYLMAIRRDFFEEDQAEKQAHVDQIDEAIKYGRAAPGEQQYIPKSGIRYQP